MSKKRLLYAQTRVLRWLQGRVKDQFVKAYIQTEIELLERIGFPINSNGMELVFEKRQRIIKQLPGQINLIEEKKQWESLIKKPTEK